MKWLKSHPLRSIALGLFLGAFFFAVYCVLIEPSRLVLRELDVAVAADMFDPLPKRVAVVADLHVGSPLNGPKRLSRIVEKVNATDPDIVLLLGDYLISGVIGGTHVPPAEIGEILGELEAPLGVYGVLGNHDWWEDGPGMRRALEANGIVVLDDAAIKLGSEALPFWLVGIADDTTRQPDAKRAFSSVPVGAPNIVMTHDPGIYFDFPHERQTALMLAGHTHGGQVYLPFLFDPIIPGRAGPEWARGLLEHQNTPLFISSGIGTSILPVRLNVPPEIVVLNLSRDD